MKKKEREFQRRLRQEANQEGHVRRRCHWAAMGSKVIMEDPTEEHVKALLMEWVKPKPFLKHRWTAELDQDLKAYHSADVEPQLARMLDEWLGAIR